MRLVEEERKKLPHDDRWTAFLDDMPRTQGDPAAGSPAPPPGEHCQGFDRTGATNVYRAAAGRATHVVTVNLPLGDLTSDQARALATSPAATPATTSAPPSSRTSCSAS